MGCCAVPWPERVMETLNISAGTARFDEILVQWQWWWLISMTIYLLEVGQVNITSKNKKERKRRRNKEENKKSRRKIITATPAMLGTTLHDRVKVTARCRKTGLDSAEVAREDYSCTSPGFAELLLRGRQRGEKFTKYEI